MLRGIYTAGAADSLARRRRRPRSRRNGRVGGPGAHRRCGWTCDRCRHCRWNTRLRASRWSSPARARRRVTCSPGWSPIRMYARSGRPPTSSSCRPSPTAGTVCPCSKVTVDDLQMVWDKGFEHLELMKRASLCGTGTCQGGACLPHLRAFVTAKSGHEVAPFTGRPASRQLTIGEAAADVHLDPFRRTALHHEHLALGARMDRFGGWWRPWNYGNFLDEYWAVREGVSLGDVSTLGKMIVTGPDVVEALERIYPTTIHDIRPGRSRYVLLLNERGHVIDDGMVCREVDRRRRLRSLRADVHLRRRVVRRGVDPRLDRDVGARRTRARSHVGARARSMSPDHSPGNCCTEWVSTSRRDSCNTSTPTLPGSRAT